MELNLQQNCTYRINSKRNKLMQNEHIYILKYNLNNLPRSLQNLLTFASVGLKSSENNIESLSVTCKSLQKTLLWHLFKFINLQISMISSFFNFNNRNIYNENEALSHILCKEFWNLFRHLLKYVPIYELKYIILVIQIRGY